MKLAVAMVSIFAISGCAGAAVPVVSVGTTTLTGATITPSALAPAAWDGEESSAASAAAPAPAAPAISTWGAAAVTSPATK
jgi:hypothetical protein